MSHSRAHINVFDINFTLNNIFCEITIVCSFAWKELINAILLSVMLN